MTTCLSTFLYPLKSEKGTFGQFLDDHGYPPDQGMISVGSISVLVLECQLEETMPQFGDLVPGGSAPIGFEKVYTGQTNLSEVEDLG